MPETTNLNIRVDRDLKAQADRTFAALGLNLTSAVTAFLSQSVREQRVPFEITMRPKNNENAIAKARAAMDEMHRLAKENGMDKMTMEEIDAEIDASRATGKTREQPA
jgi:DNA-damage-inducible protein J